MTGPIILWFREDLRLADHPALTAALATGLPVLPLYISDDEAPGRWAIGGAARWWLHGSLERLTDQLGGRLHLARGPAERVIDDLIARTGASGVYWNRRYAPWAIAQDRAVKERLKVGGLDVRSFAASLGHEPWEVLQAGGAPYKVFTPYSRAWGRQPLAAPLPRPESLAALTGIAGGDRLDAWALRPTRPDWAAGLRQTWTPGEEGARDALSRFLDDSLADYSGARDRPGEGATSRLSPHLHAGEISARQVHHAVQASTASGAAPSAQAHAFIRQLCWRDFANANLFHFPRLPEEPLRPEFAAFPWAEDEGALRRWQRGMTGYPLVDAGMRQLWHTGYMENRVRMVVGSFLTKDLRLPWQAGAAWFWDTLVDADLANNSMGWQWVAGCGIDAAPYFRIFNPTTQAETWDADGSYIRRWAPELARLPNALLHRPWEAPASALAAAGVVLDVDYPRPMVDHGRARAEALAAYQRLRAEGQPTALG